MKAIDLEKLTMRALKDQFLNNVEDSFYVAHIKRQFAMMEFPQEIDGFRGRLDPLVFLNKKIFELVSFDNRRFPAWLAEANNFARSNVEHTEFAQIFSGGLNYNIILADMLKVDSSAEIFSDFAIEAFDNWLVYLRLLDRQDIKTLEIMGQSDGESEVFRTAAFKAYQRGEHLEKLLHDQELIRDSIRFNEVGKTLPSILVLMIRQDVIKGLVPALEIVARNLQSANSSARRKTSRAISSADTVTKDLDIITKDPSLKAIRGDIDFAVVESKFALQSSNQVVAGSLNQNDVYNTLKGTIDKIIGDGIVDRIVNHDKTLADTISAYAALCITMPKDKDALNLYLTGHQIHSRLTVNSQLPEAEKIDPSPVKNLEFLLSVHGIFMTTLPSSNNIIDAIERSSNQFARFQSAIEEFNFDTLGVLSKQTDLFDSRTIGVLEKAKEQKESLKKKYTKGVIALESGLIRGALRAVSVFVLNGMKKGVIAVRMVIVESLIEEVAKGSNLFRNVVAFLNQHRAALESLADEMPSRFSWIGSLVRFLFKAPNG
jgi:hypothetical protein